MFLNNLTGKLFKNFPKPSLKSFLSTTTTLNSSKISRNLLAEGNGGKKIVGYWLAGTSAAVFGIIVFGGLTRLTESGLSMVDWKLIHFSAPKNEDEWKAYFEKYKEFPEYKMYLSRRNNFKLFNLLLLVIIRT